jgi:hypothetical protein
LFGKPEEARPLGRHRCRWEDNFKIDLRKMRAWTGFIWFRDCSVVGASEHGNEPSGSIKGREILDGVTINFLRKIFRHGVHHRH